MNQMIAAMIGCILMALHLSSQVAAQNGTTAAMPTTTMNGTNMTMTGNGTDMGNGTRGPTDASVSVHANTLTVLVSVALAAFSSLLHSRV